MTRDRKRTAIREALGRATSSYIKTDGSTDQVLNMPQSDPQLTSKTPVGASTSIRSIIPQTTTGVKGAEATDLGGQLLDLDPVTQMELKDLALDMLEKEKGTTTPDGEISISESEIGDIFRRAVKGFTAGGKVVGFTGLPQEHQTSFLTGLDSADPEVRSVLMQVYDRVDYAMKQDTDRSYYRRGIGQNIIYLGKKATASTIAHELFHWIDKDRQISQSLLSGLTQDFIALNVASGGDIKEYLIERYPEAFRKNEWGQIIMRPQYRGIADIFNGFSDGEVYYGYGHKAEYWKRQGVLEAEAWAQFGRILFDNDPKVLKMFAKIFPDLWGSAIMIIKKGEF